MKKNYNAPKLSVHGSIEELTQSKKGRVNKYYGSDDGMYMSINGAPSIGSW